MMKNGLNYAWLKLPGRLFMLIVLFAPLSASAISAGKQIVDEAVDASDANYMRLELQFVMRVNYLWHFPHARKDEFLIAVQPISGLADYDTTIREHIRIPPGMRNVITDLYYDGTQGNNRFVVLETSRNVAINVTQGADGRSIIIEFESIAPEPAPDCASGTKKDDQGKK